MEDLNKNQIVLLTLLVSFVTSIATGIITTSLLQQAPVEVVRNINSIVEKTIEKVTPATVTTTSPAGTKEVTTIIVKEEDVIIDSINKNIKSIARIEEKETLLGFSSFYGIGLVVTKEGLIMADRKTITAENKYIATMSDGTVFTLTPQGVDKKTNFILFKAIVPTKVADNGTTITTSDNTAGTILANQLAQQKAATSYVFVPAIFGESEPKLGQTIISLGGESVNAVAVGRVTSLGMKESTVGTTTTKYLASIDADISTKNLVDGSPIFNLSGAVVGVKLSDDPSKSFTPIALLKNELTTLLEVPKTP